MADIIGVKFKSGGKVYYFAPNEEQFELGDGVIVETARGLECGEVALERRSIPDERLVYQLKPVVRKATAEDMKRLEENRRREQTAFDICVKRIAKHGLDMKLVSVEYTFDGSKIVFCFTADGRVDFRELVKDLAGVFRTRIELRQIGVRDEARMLGGLGVCGRPFCCATFLNDFQPVSIKMAKEQGLSLNPVKISGACGRLMCCLKYEQEAYDDLLRCTPRIGAVVTTEDGRGVVVDRNVITGSLKVQIDDDQGAPKTYNVKKVRWSGSRRNEEESEEELEANADPELLSVLDEEDKPKTRRHQEQRGGRTDRGDGAPRQERRERSGGHGSEEQPRRQNNRSAQGAQNNQAPRKPAQSQQPRKPRQELKSSRELPGAQEQADSEPLSLTPAQDTPTRQAPEQRAPQGNRGGQNGQNRQKSSRRRQYPQKQRKPHNGAPEGKSGE